MKSSPARTKWTLARFKVDFERFHEIRDLPTAAEREALTPSRASPGAKVDVNMCL